MPLNIFLSNRLENLSEALVKIIATPAAAPLAPEVIVVQSRGMQRWLSLQIAGKLGIAANLSFPFPNALVNEIIERIWPDFRSVFEKETNHSGQLPAELGAYTPAVLTWEIMKLLPDSAGNKAFRQLNHYLAGRGSVLKRLQLAMRIADLFDQYLLYRPEMFLRWEAGRDEQWQAQLWRKIVKHKKGPHRAALGSELLKWLHKTEELDGLPKRINIFGISALPEFHISVLSALAKTRAVNLFILNPCREYWGDIRSSREIRKMAGVAAQLEMDFSGEPSQALHLESGNSLLASLGKLGRDFFDLLQDNLDGHTSELFQEPEGDTLLCSIQEDILKLREPALQNGRKHKLSAGDKSVQFHSCHSQRREIEVLHDQLLDLFQRDPGLKPADILVMAPDIEPYAPFIQAVFDRPAGDPKRIPFSIADRTFRHEDRIITVFFAILRLHGSRLAASEVMSILEEPAILRRFSLNADDLDLIRDWLENARIRWGINAEHLHKLGLPPHAENTWQAGIDRLLLGYALPGHEQRAYGAISPYDKVEGRQTQTLGNFIEFTDQLFATAESLAGKRTLKAWGTELGRLLDRFFSDRDEAVARQLQVLRNEITRLGEYQDLSAFDEEVELRVVQHHLEDRLQRDGLGFGFLSGAVTFCSILPMRSIPVEVLCLIGMNNDSFPVSKHAISFDLIAQQPRKGDRSRRHDDRYLFLEALLSARRKLYVSYVGQSIKDNTEAPPSVLISEFGEYLDSNYELSSSEKPFESLTTVHRLQAFSPAYFAGGADAGINYFSYSEENGTAAAILVDSDKTVPAFCDEQLAEPDGEFRQVTLLELYRFFRNPVAHFFMKRLGIRLEAREAGLTDTESFRFSGLEQYGAANDLMAKNLAGEETTDFRQAKLCSGALPLGGQGEVAYQMLEKNVAHFVESLQPYVASKPLLPLEIELALAGFQVSGTIHDIYADGVMNYRLARVKAKDHLLAWIRHLALCCAHPVDYPQQSYLAGVNSAAEGVWTAWSFAPVTDAQDILAQLLELYAKGLRRPLRFFPNSALTFAGCLHSGGIAKRGQALKNAAGEFNGSSRNKIPGIAESDDPYIYRAFAHEENPLNNEFETLALSVFAPMLDSRNELAG